MSYETLITQQKNEPMVLSLGADGDDSNMSLSSNSSVSSRASIDSKASSGSKSKNTRNATKKIPHSSYFTDTKKEN